MLAAARVKSRVSTGPPLLVRSRRSRLPPRLAVIVGAARLSFPGRPSGRVSHCSSYRRSRLLARQASWLSPQVDDLPRPRVARRSCRNPPPRHPSTAAGAGGSVVSLHTRLSNTTRPIDDVFSQVVAADDMICDAAVSGTSVSSTSLRVELSVLMRLLWGCSAECRIDEMQ